MNPTILPITVTKGSTQLINIIMEDKPDLRNAIIKMKVGDYKNVFFELLPEPESVLNADDDHPQVVLIFKVLPIHTQNLRPDSYFWSLTININNDMYIPIHGRFAVIDPIVR